MEESAAASKTQCCSSSAEQTADRSHHHHQGNSGTVLEHLCFNTYVFTSTTKFTPRVVSKCQVDSFVI